MKTFGLVILAAVVAIAVWSVAADEQASDGPLGEGWILGADNEAERFERIQRYLRGFDQPMWEVGERYLIIHDALSRNNPELASYHWDKIRTTITNGYMKRPARQPNSDLLFIDSLWNDVAEDFASGNIEQNWVGFEKAKMACMSCHIAESVPFINNQSMFDLAPNH